MAGSQGEAEPEMEGALLVAGSRAVPRQVTHRDARLLPALWRRGHMGEVLDDLLGVLCLPSPGLATVGVGQGEARGVGNDAWQALPIARRAISRQDPSLLQEALQDYSRAENGLILTICRGQRGTCHLRGSLQQNPNFSGWPFSFQNHFQGIRKSFGFDV